MGISEEEFTGLIPGKSKILYKLLNQEEAFILEDSDQIITKYGPFGTLSIWDKDDFMKFCCVLELKSETIKVKIRDYWNSSSQSFHTGTMSPDYGNWQKVIGSEREIEVIDE